MQQQCHLAIFWQTRNHTPGLIGYTWMLHLLKITNIYQMSCKQMIDLNIDLVFETLARIWLCFLTSLFLPSETGQLLRTTLRFWQTFRWQSHSESYVWIFLSYAEGEIISSINLYGIWDGDDDARLVGHGGKTCNISALYFIHPNIINANIQLPDQQR